MPPLRLGLIGLGNIGRHHANYLLEGRVPQCQLVAVCAPNLSKLEPYAARGLHAFTDAEQLISSGLLDAVLIATPHYQHTSLGIAALEAGLHVMVEKPISAHKADAERLLACAAAHPLLVLAGMFQLRVEPRYAKLRALLAAGELGRLQRITWINTDWFRTEAYYASGGWRATWKGEGGGVLLNQCLHNLDVLSWLFGRPARVRGFCQFGQWHQIEVEDQVTAWFEYPDGATGTFISSTGEAPGTNRFEIAGSRGRVVLENNRLTFTRSEADALEWSRTAQVGFSKPEVWNIDIPFTDATNPHATLMQNFVAAIQEGTPLIAPGADGLLSVELANAIVHSSLTGQTLNLPLDGAAWEAQLQQLIAQSRFTKEVRPTATDDFAASFRR
ncbi:MAG: Gfo/Idh/MocA family oxidoreductase [Verrucomicrobia bacterium]|nr:Gfo/Idh/MocA family oxidoreductase [Verrucomicrobiota bacterium]